MRRALLAIAAALTLAACHGETSSRAPCPAGKLCLEAGNGSEPNSLDPHKMQGTWESRIARDFLVGLTDVDAAGNVIPGMAERWETSADGLVWTFHLRDAKWSDGVPVTAGDFQFALRRVLDPKTAAEYASLLYFIKNAQPVNEGKAPLDTLGVTAIDPHTLRITLEHPAPYILQLAKHQTMSPVPEHVVKKWGEAWSRPEHIVGNGPYRIVSWRLGDRIMATRNPYYWDKAHVCLDQVSYYPTDDAASAERQIKRGDLDMASPIRANRIAYLRKPGRMPTFVHTNTYLGVSYLAFNESLPKFKDRRVRTALSMAVDRDFLVSGIFMSSGRPAAYTFVPPGVAGYTQAIPPEWAGWSLDKRRAEAKALLAAAGYGPSHPLTVEIKHRGTEAGAVFASIQNDWKEIGVKTTLVGAETQIAYQSFRLRDFEIADAGWIADYNDPLSFLYLMQSKTGAMNYGDYNNPAYDGLLAKADAEADPVRRAVYLRQAEAIMLADAPVIPLTFEVNSNLVSPRVTGFADNITDEHPSRFLCLKR